jgi:hypothetical protein
MRREARGVLEACRIVAWAMGEDASDVVKGGDVMMRL